jgi:hypothetical protein
MIARCKSCPARIAAAIAHAAGWVTCCNGVGWLCPACAPRAK